MNFSRRRFPAVTALLLILPILLFGAVLGDGSLTVTTAGTAQRLVSVETLAIWVTVQCAVDNTTNCFVGASTIADGRGVELAPGLTHHFPPMPYPDVYDLYEMWGDVATSGEILTFTYAQRGP